MKKYIFLILFLSLASGSWSQEDDLHGDYQKAVEAKQQLVQLYQAMVEEVFARFHAQDIQLQEEMEKIEDDIFVRKAKREMFIKEYEELIQPQENVSEIKVALLGNSARFFDPRGYNEEVLVKILQSIKEHQPNAVFFMGNMVYGLKIAKMQGAAYVQMPQEKNIFGKVTNRTAGYYDKSYYQGQLDAFGNTVQETLGKDVPFYPLPAEHEVIGAEALELFHQRFPVPGAQIIDAKEMVYAVPLGNSFFLVLSSDYYDAEQNKVVEDQIISPVIEWLGGQLKEQAPKYRFTFVVGNDPAFSTEASFGIYSGLDRHREERNRFWNLLMKHQVLAFFSSNEVLYDRSYRYGVWQVISGGAGATHDIIGEDDTFYHYLLLTIPQEGTGDPKMTVYDINGKKRDEFVLTRHPGALFDLRISNSL